MQKESIWNKYLSPYVIMWYNWSTENRLQKVDSLIGEFWLVVTTHRISHLLSTYKCCRYDSDQWRNSSSLLFIITRQRVFVVISQILSFSFLQIRLDEKIPYNSNRTWFDKEFSKNFIEKAKINGTSFGPMNVSSSQSPNLTSRENILFTQVWMKRF